MKKDLAILIVHYNTPGLLRQTLKGIFAFPPQRSFEVIVVDNNPKQRVRDWVQKEFPFVKIMTSDQNIGFGRGMNLAMRHSDARYLLVFNPDIAVFEGVFDKMISYMDGHQNIGILGPKLLNPDRTLQYSCYRFMGPSIIFNRRIPILRSLSFAKKSDDLYQMKDWDHSEVKNVDYLLGAVMLARKEAVDQVGEFDPAYFIYFEDQDWCRRFWLAGWRVVYNPEIEIVHYHRRETAEGSFIQQLRNPLTRLQIKSAIYYYKKYKGQKNPRHAYERLHSSN